MANRVTEILKQTTVQQWRYVSTQLNPTDYASRGQNAAQLVQNLSWVSEPHFLTEVVETWPKIPEHLNVLSGIDPEIKKNATINILTLREKSEPLEQLVQHILSGIS